ncbi:MAG: hypothetical protein V1735_04765 [Nanoarchaeota archaeon]
MSALVKKVAALLPERLSSSILFSAVQKADCKGALAREYLRDYEGDTLEAALASAGRAAVSNRFRHQHNPAQGEEDVEKLLAAGSYLDALRERYHPLLDGACCENDVLGVMTLDYLGAEPILPERGMAQALASRFVGDLRARLTSAERAPRIALPFGHPYLARTLIDLQQDICLVQQGLRGMAQETETVSRLLRQVAPGYS